VGLSLERVPGLDKQRPHPWMVKVIYRLPGFMKPKAQYPGYLLEFDATGQLLRFAADESAGEIAQVTAGTVLAGRNGVQGTEVVVGSLLVPAVRRLQLRPVVGAVVAASP
jgi:hypothetical protein